MSNSLQPLGRTLLSAARPARRRPIKTTSTSTPCIFCTHTSILPQRRNASSSTTTSSPSRYNYPPQASTSSISNQHQSPTPATQSSKQAGRWAQTPPLMKAPVPIRQPPSDYKPLNVNNDPDRLDAMYRTLLGKNGDKMLSTETKWLCVTHKSFDHGRRGFNERLAFLGKRILDLEASLALIASADTPEFKQRTTNLQEDQHGRQPFVHPATQGSLILLGDEKNEILDHKALSRVASKYGIPEVIRWHPKNVPKLEEAGMHTVYAQAVLAILGALALEQGSIVASKVARERIMSIGR